MSAPATLAARCFPGCMVDEVEEDGTHLCVARFGTVRLPATGWRFPRGRALAVELTRVQGPGGDCRTRVEVVQLDEAGRYFGDAFEVDRATVRELAVVLAAALDLAVEDAGGADRGPSVLTGR